jgi:hypothetical protein
MGVPVALPLVTQDSDKTLFLDRPRRQYESSDNPIEKYTILLNFCIDDIEKFCADVKVMQQRPMMTIMLPRNVDLQAHDFVRIFQKFKLAFNLLVSNV